MENFKINQDKYESKDEGEILEEEIDYDDLTSHKIEKNVHSLKKKKHLIVILEHAYKFYLL